MSNASKIKPTSKNIIRVGALGYLKAINGSYKAFTAGDCLLGEFATFQQAVAAVKAQ